MRKTDMITYMVPTRRFDSYQIEEVKGYCVLYVDDKNRRAYYFMIRKNGKYWQVDHYNTGFVIGRCYSTYREACASILYMINYKNLLGSLDLTMNSIQRRGGRILNGVDPGDESWKAVRIYLPEERSENNAADIT